MTLLLLYTNWCDMIVGDDDGSCKKKGKGKLGCLIEIGRAHV